MIVKLKVLHGTLQNRKGESAGLEVAVRRPCFVIGSARDCGMCCPSRTVSSHHCEIRLDGERVLVRDLNSGTGTYVNERRVEHEQPLQEGDQLRIGRLDFEVLIDRSAPPRKSALSAAKVDPVADYISDLLVEKDEEDRARRLEDPETRQFRVPASQPQAGCQALSATQGLGGDAKRKLPRKKPPGKLPPPPPPVVADNTQEAAEEVLKKMFTREKR